MKILFMLISIFSANVIANTNVNMMAHVNEHRESITLNLKSKIKFDYFCENVSVSINYENPKDYSFHTQVIKNVKHLYAKSSEISSKIIAQKLTDEMREMFNDTVIIRDASINLEDTKCRRAKFSEYCDHANLNDDERYTLDVIMQELGVGSCHELDAKVNIKKLDLSNQGILDIKAVKFFYKLKYLNISQNQLFFNVKELKEARNSFPLNRIKKVVYSLAN